MVFPGQILRNKEGEVVTEEQIKKYEAEMRAKGVGTGGLVTDANPVEKAQPSASAKTAASADKSTLSASAGKTSAPKSDAKTAAKKEVPGDLF